MHSYVFSNTKKNTQKIGSALKINDHFCYIPKIIFRFFEKKHEKKHFGASSGVIGAASEDNNGVTCFNRARCFTTEDQMNMQ